MKSSVGPLSGFVAVVLCAIPTLTLAHHGVGAQFDLSQTIELQGEIKELLWRNPHVRFTLGVVDASGDEALWVVEAQSITGLRQRDITQVLFDVGDQITLAGNPAHGGKTEIYATNALLPDGREVLFAQTVEPRWSDLAMGATGPRFPPYDALAPKRQHKLLRRSIPLDADSHLIAPFDRGQCATQIGLGRNGHVLKVGQ